MARRRTNPHEHPMTDLPTPDAAPDADGAMPDATFEGDPELAALVRRDASPADADPSPVADAGAPPIGEVDTADAPPTSAPEAETVPALPVAAAMTDGESPKPRRRRRSLVLRFGLSFVLGILLALGIGVGALYAWELQYDGRVLPGVFIGKTELSGLSREQAAAKLASDFGWLGDGQITLTGPDGRATSMTYADLGRGPAAAAMLDAAFAAGRQGEPLANLIGVPRAAMHGVTLDPAVVYDHDKLAAAVDIVAASIYQNPADAFAWRGKNGTFGVSPAKDGLAVDKAALLSALERQLAALDTPASIAVSVPVVPLAPAMPTASAQAAKAAADRMAADVVLTHGKDKWTIRGTSLAPLISFSTAADGTIAPLLDESGLDPILKKLASKVSKNAQDASLKRIGGHIVARGTSHNGRRLNVPGMKAAVISEITSRQAGAAGGSPIEAVVRDIPPKLTAEDAKALAPKMKVISSFSVYYFVIINNHFGGNIEAPATKIDGTVVPAGGVFDFWKVVGDLRKLPGAGPGNAIEGGKITVTGAFGGGICTTSTTLFNAAFRAGMVPLARKNHNEFIDRYPPGLDATVWIVGGTKQTMSFKNDTKYPILIQRTIRQAGNRRWITFKIWSVPNGRTYKISNTVIQHGPRAIDTVVRDPNKPVGYYYRNNIPADGAKVWVTVSIYDHGKLHWSKRYFSNYPAVNGVYIVGTRR
jgi:vancomycin resistance protein YoaR